MSGIKLKNSESGETRDFEKKHAENLLNLQVEKGFSHWALVGDKFKHENGRIVSNGNSGTIKKSEK